MEIEFETSTIMMVVFIFVFIISMWKVYAFLPNKELADDDTTQESQEELLQIINKHLKENISSKDLLGLVQNDKDFDKEHFWRFNENKLKQLLRKVKTK